MDSQQGIFDAEEAHCKTIKESSLLERAKGKLGESGEAEEGIYVNKNKVMDSHEDTSSVEIPHAQLKIGELSLLKKGKGKLGEPEEAEIEMTVNTNEVMDSQDGTSYLTISDGIPNKEPSSLLDKMDSKLSKLRPADDSQEVTIFRVPLKIRESNKNMYEPSAVSIGPYHRGKIHLRAMEENKWLVLQSFLGKKEKGLFSQKTDMSEVGEEKLARALLQERISKIKEVEQRARCCYSEPFDMSSDEFVEMMVLDGCFILKYFSGLFVTDDLKAFQKGWNSWFIETDLILLDNQIPYFIIEILLGSPLDPENLMLIACRLTRNNLPIKARSGLQKIHHLLHLCLCYAVPSVSTQHAASEPNHCPFLNWIRAVPVLKYFSCSKKEEDPELGNEMRIWEIPCVTELEEAGVKFKKLERSDDITKITFQSGTLFIPCLQISDFVKPLFMNLVAMEQCMFDQLPCYFSTYMAFLDYLVNTPHDVRILQNKGILQSMLSSEEEVALFFNQSCVGVIVPEDHYLAELFKRVNKYRESRYHRYRAKLSRDYFNNPWSIVALIAATLLLCLTIIQSFMSVYAYIHPPPSSPSS